MKILMIVVAMISGLSPAIGQQMARCCVAPALSERDSATLKCFRDMPISGDYRRDARWRDACLDKIPLPK